jgi:hypothetical protein
MSHPKAEVEETLWSYLAERGFHEVLVESGWRPSPEAKKNVPPLHPRRT